MDESLVLPYGLEWNELVLEPGDPTNDSLVSILAFHDDRQPEPIGTGFIVLTTPELAVACTAAHVLRDIHRIQNPHRKYHPLALPEFQPNTEPIDLDRRRVRAIHVNTRRDVEIAIIGWAFWDKSSDIAFFSLLRQGGPKSGRFESFIEIDGSVPEAGSMIFALGYRGMEATNGSREESGKEGFHFARQLLVRAGRVSAIHPGGFGLCKGPCIETTIPVFPGMSGGPVIRPDAIGQKPQVFGLVSSDFDFQDPVAKLDRSQKGTSMMALLGATIQVNAAGQREALMRLNEGFWSLNKDELTRLANEERPEAT